MNSDLPTRLQNARITLLLDFEFWGQLAMRLAPKITNDASKIDTACTDGIHIWFNEDFCSSLTQAELVWLYAHEVSHCALGHMFRIGPRNPQKFNKAADYVVNAMIEEVLKGKKGATNRMSRINSCLLDAKFNGLSVEQIYELLPDDEDGPSAMGTFVEPSSQSGEGDGEGDGAGNQPDKSELEAEWKAAAAQAATVARSRNKGELPGALQTLLSELYEPAIAWQDMLRQFASRICRDDYSWKRPNRRYAHQGFILPTLRTEGLGRVVVATDTSGSIRGDSELLTQFLTELQEILDASHPEALHMIDCDCRIQAHHVFHSGDDLRGTSFKGGGGTDFRPVFEYAESRDLQPDCLIYFTDMMGSFPEEAPPYPVLWLNYGYPGAKAPFGETIHVPQVARAA